MSDPKQTECSNLTETRWKDGCTIYAIIKTMYPPCYHHNGFVTTHALGLMMHGCAKVHELPQSHCGDK